MPRAKKIPPSLLIREWNEKYDGAHNTGYLSVNIDVAIEKQTDDKTRMYGSITSGPVFVKIPLNSLDDPEQWLPQEANNVYGYIEQQLRKRYVVESLCDH